MEILIIKCLDYLATFIFGIVGSFRAIKYELDLFGVIFISIITSCLGGIIRDTILKVDITFFNNYEYLIISIIAGILSFYFNRRIVYLWKYILILDSVGLILFTLIGNYKAYLLNSNNLLIVFSGFITACGGGLIKDILINRIPDLFIEDIYGTLSIIIGIIFLLGIYLNINLVNFLIVLFVVMLIIRLFIIRKSINLPRVKKLKYSPIMYRRR